MPILLYIPLAVGTVAILIGGVRRAIEPVLVGSLLMSPWFVAYILSGPGRQGSTLAESIAMALLGLALAWAGRRLTWRTVMLGGLAFALLGIVGLIVAGLSISHS